MPTFRVHVVDAEDNSNIRVEDVEVDENVDPMSVIVLNEGEGVDQVVPLAENQ